MSHRRNSKKKFEKFKKIKIVRILQKIKNKSPNIWAPETAPLVDSQNSRKSKTQKRDKNRGICTILKKKQTIKIKKKLIIKTKKLIIKKNLLPKSMKKNNRIN